MVAEKSISVSGGIVGLLHIYTCTQLHMANYMSMYRDCTTKVAEKKLAFVCKLESEHESQALFDP